MTTDTIVMTAQSAPMTAACANSFGRSDPAPRSLTGAILPGQEPACPQDQRSLPVFGEVAGDWSRIAKLCNYGYMDNVVETANIEPQQGLGADLLAVVARLNRLATQRIQMPLPAAQARLLATIDAHGEARIGDLAAVDHCSQPTMTTQVRRLEEAGLVARTIDPGDARAVRIRITAEGMRTLNAVRADRAAAIEPQLALLEPAERQVLADAVEVLRRLLENAAVAARRNTL
jgi:DNA-binding MarR family transcriptional regulator